jgi:hypothetical protein
MPVDFKGIPMFTAQCKPDWDCNASTISSTMHYQSTRVIGKLFRQVRFEEKPPRSAEEFSMDGEGPRDHPFFFWKYYNGVSMKSFRKNIIKLQFNPRENGTIWLGE